MRRPRTDHSQIDLTIDIVPAGKGYHLIKYFNTDGCKSVLSCKQEDVAKQVENIGKERNNFCIWDNGKETYPMRKK